jgi:phage terminase large subunit GpA-like protein
MIATPTKPLKLPLRTRQAWAAELRSFVAHAKPRQLRTRRQWAEQEFVHPSGRFKNEKWDAKYQPFAGMLLDEMDKEEYRRTVIAGCVQSGKTQTGFIIPIMWHLFELREDVICGIPLDDMASNKWLKDIQPAIDTSSYKNLLPQQGAGSRGGKFDTISFRHGVRLKFMSGGGSDKSRAGFESRVVIITETDGLDTAGEGSRETDKVKQLEARTYSHGDRKQVYMECSVSTEEGRTWSEYQKSTRSRIALRCPPCKHFVTLEREHFTGWEEATNIEEAKALGRFHCCDCGEQWSEQDRIAANHDAILLHGDQTADSDGTIHGERPITDTLGFRWSAVNNLFWSQAFIAGEEWKAAREEDRENAEKERLQFCWVKPYRPPLLDLAELRVETIPNRILPQIGPQLVPDSTVQFTIGTDYNSRFVHYCAIAWREGCAPHVNDYGAIPVQYDRQQKTDSVAFEQALLNALRELFTRCDRGWPWQFRNATRRPDQVWIDSGWKPEILYKSLEGRDVARYRPVKGYGESQELRFYQRPQKLSDSCRYLGPGYHLSFQPDRPQLLAHIDTDEWKTYWHSRLTASLSNLAAAPCTLFDDLSTKHAEIARHWTAEKFVEEWEPGKKIRRRWQRIRRDNHWLDAAVYASAAGNYMGVTIPQLAPAATILSPQPPAPSPLITPDNQPYFVLDR